MSSGGRLGREAAEWRPDRLSAWALDGIPEIEPGADLAALIGDALAADPDGIADGDILIVTSKIVSKAEGRIIEAADREDAITAETVRVVATRAWSDGSGVTRIVENRLGVVGAAAGVDASNTAEGTVLLLPVDPDASARALGAALRGRFGIRIGIVVSDTLGRAWRIGQTDIAIGAAGVHVVDDLRGSTDSQGRPLAVTVPVVADELAALGDLVKGKASGRPVAVVRGMSRLVTDEIDTPGARTLPRTGPTDMFRLGTDEAYAAGYADAAAGRPADPVSAGVVHVPAGRLSEANAPGRLRPLAAEWRPDPRRVTWTVVIPFKGAPASKSRLSERFDDADRHELALAFFADTVTAVRRADGVTSVVIVSNEPNLHALLDADASPAPAPLTFVPDPGDGLNTAISAGLAVARAADPGAHRAALLGDLPELQPHELADALRPAAKHPHAFVADAAGTGTTLITLAPQADAAPRFGPGSAAAHRAAGFTPLDLPATSGLRRDVDAPADLDGLRAPGSHTQAVLSALAGRR